jgi:hypothetical protein
MAALRPLGRQDTLPKQHSFDNLSLFIFIYFDILYLFT